MFPIVELILIIRRSNPKRPRIRFCPKYSWQFSQVISHRWLAKTSSHICDERAHNRIRNRYVGIPSCLPTKCRQRLLGSIHSSHLGIVKSKAVARSFMWWPGIDAELESLIKSCKSCLSVRSNPPKSNLIPWEVPDRVWSRIHIDYAGPFIHFHFLIITDAFSKWPEVFKTNNFTSKLIS